MLDTYITLMDIKTKQNIEVPRFRSLLDEYE